MANLGLLVLGCWAWAATRFGLIETEISMIEWGMFFLGLMFMASTGVLILLSLKALWDDRDYDKDNNGDFDD